LLAEAVRRNAEGSRLFKLAVGAVEAHAEAGSGVRGQPSDGAKQNPRCGRESAGACSCAEAGRSGEGNASEAHALASTEGREAPSLLFRRALGCFETGLALLGLHTDGSRIDSSAGGSVSTSDVQISCGCDGAGEEAHRAAQRLAARRSPTVVVRLFSNAAAAHQRLGSDESALACCTAGLRLDPTHAKLLSRRAQVRNRASRPILAAKSPLRQRPSGRPPPLTLPPAPLPYQLQPVPLPRLC
jgi:hypothetical protein